MSSSQSVPSSHVGGSAPTPACRKVRRCKKKNARKKQKRQLAAEQFRQQLADPEHQKQVCGARCSMAVNDAKYSNSTSAAQLFPFSHSLRIVQLALEQKQMEEQIAQWQRESEEAKRMKREADAKVEAMLRARGWAPVSVFCFPRLTSLISCVYGLHSLIFHGRSHLLCNSRYHFRHTTSPL